MQTFRYQAISPDGKKLSGIIEAPDEYAAVARLREMDAAITKITPVRGHNQAHSQFTTGKISERALSMMCSQFAVILGSGMPIVRAVELIAGQTQDKTLRQILQQAAGDVASGLSLAQSLKNRGKNLPVTFIEMVRSGEESGTLDVAFKRLQTYYDKSFQSKSKVKAAMTYPVFTLIVAAIVVVIIMVVAVPAFTTSFSSMGVELPWITRGLIAISGFFTKFWLLLVIVIGGGILHIKCMDVQRRASCFTRASGSGCRCWGGLACSKPRPSLQARFLLCFPPACRCFRRFPSPHPF